MSPWQHCPPNASAAGGPGPRGNGTGRAAERGSAVSVAIPLTMMLTGIVGNALAMLLVSRSYRAKGSRRKRSFLLCIGSLALTDMLGQLLTSPIVISVYLSGRPWAAMDPSGRLCDFFGFSMTVFGLCPLLIASAMAVERALAIRAPHWYASHMSPRATERGLAAIWAAGVAFALLPLAGLGRYALQWPGTWCFISAAGGSAFAAAFAALGLLSLVVTGACNLATIEALVSRCRAKAGAAQPGSRWGRIATETLLQLLGIMCVLSACWAPLLERRSGSCALQPWLCEGLPFLNPIQGAGVHLGASTDTFTAREAVFVACFFNEAFSACSLCVVPLPEALGEL
ncbi:prostaglandin E2 receptor EP3 subtype isoform X2 [Vidua chalybeata]|uniref:prostaglandin E2 receptor EP3 subtype isoform X2 n=1 Tax=Vidua chalybeata TaxID=81927 RepID=UPI0023A83F8F|nr:prostaglandin E2 receptor EP3 subtype isoform X2 [Vidua chalybeata]